MPEIAHTSIPLPGNYRTSPFMAFHQRDAQELAERTSADSLEKGLVWNGAPACVRIRFQKKHAEATLAVDGTPPCAEAQVQELARRMLGLDQPVEACENALAAHPVVGRLIASGSGLRIPQTPTPFEALSWAIIGQQVSIHAAISIRRKFIAAAGIRHSGGLYCFPGPESVAAMGVPLLRETGFSQTKALSLITLSTAVAAGELAIDSWPEQLREGHIDADTIQKKLTALRGIGPWTVSYALLRGFGWLDGSLHGDVAVRRNLARFLGKEEGVTEKETLHWLAEFTPWRALVAAYLWAMESSDGF